jgi:hypothetical protein
MTNRILWNERGRDIDEIVVHDCTVHVEQMSDRCWWIGIHRNDGGYWAGNFVADSRGRMRFVEQDPPEGFVWEQDRSHEAETPQMMRSVFPARPGLATVELAEVDE